MKKILFGMTAIAAACAVQIEALDASIPVVELARYYDPETKEAFLEEVRDALHEVGFFAVVDSAVDLDLVDAGYAAAEEFFNLDLEEKVTCEDTSTGGQRGYVRSEMAKGQDVKDYKEFYHIGREKESEDKLGGVPNVWPELDGFKETMIEYHSHLDERMVEIQHVILDALMLSPNDQFDESTAEGACLLRLLHYPATKNQTDERAVWGAAHTDIDFFTILPRSTAEGLEVQLGDGTWASVYVEGDAFIVNGGDFLEAYSNGYFKAARHRIMAPESNPEQERYSMVYFVHFEADHDIYPLSWWVEKTGGVEKYAHCTENELLFERLADLGIAADWMLEELGTSETMDKLLEVGRASPDAMCALRAAGYASDTVLQELEKQNL